MDNLNLIVANNFKAIREAKKISLDKVAEMTGVSKSMLGQIERGESNPTMTTMWKIANGLKIPFTSLITTPKPDTAIVKKDEVEPYTEDKGKFRNFPIFPYEEGRRFDGYMVEIEKGGYWSSDPHGEGTEEFITVFAGELTVRVDDEEYTIGTYDSIRFRADKPHAYHNSGEKMTRLSMVIYYHA